MTRTRKSDQRLCSARTQLRFEALENRQMLAAQYGFDVNLYQDAGGVPGDLITNDTVQVGEEFFVEITAADLRAEAQGLGSMAVDVIWNPHVLREIDEPFDPTDPGTQLVTAAFPLTRRGTLDNEVGWIHKLRGMSLSSMNVGRPIGMDGPERFALLHFRAVGQADDSPLRVRSSSNVGFIPWRPYTQDDLIFESQVITVVPDVEVAAGTAITTLMAAGDLVIAPPASTVVPAGETAQVTATVGTTEIAVGASVPSATATASAEIATADSEQLPAWSSTADPPSSAAVITPQPTADNTTSAAPPTASVTVVTSVSWRNPVNPHDVNGTGGVTPVDALVLVNYINAHPGNLSLPSVRGTSAFFLDVNGDAVVTARDVLCVINYLEFPGNSIAAGAGEADPLGVLLPEAILRPTLPSDSGTSIVAEPLAPWLSPGPARHPQPPPDPVATDAVFALAEQTAAITASDADELDGGCDFLAAAGLGLT